MKKLLSLMSLLLALCLLVACHSNRSKSDAGNSSSSSAQVSDKTDEDNQSSEEEEADDEDTDEEDSGMDIEAIAEGDFSSIAGTWKNGRGDVMVFDDEGLDSSSFRVKLDYSDVKDGILRGSYIQVNSQVGGAVIQFAPEGTVFKDDGFGQEDKSDNSKDRIWIGQSPSYSNMADFYYKVDDQVESDSTTSSKHKSQSVDEAVHRTDTGVQLTGGTSSSDYATQILGDKGWIVDSGSYGRTNDVPYNFLRSSSGESVWVYQNGVIIGEDNQILYEP